MVKILGALAVLLMFALTVQTCRVQSAHGEASAAGDRAARAEGERDAARDALADAGVQAARMDEIGTKHEQDRVDAESVPADVVADLRAGARRLQNHWAACETNRLSDAATAAGERDAAAQRREADIGDLVRVGRQSDDQLRACQAVITADRLAP